MGGHATMAAGFDKLERRLEKLGKVIAKKGRDLSRGSFGVDGTSPLSLAAVSDSILRTFPPPSFIRPTSSRMIAREEVSLTPRPEQRSKSLPETPGTPHLASPTSTLEGEPTPRTSISQPPRIPKRSSSLGPARRPASLASLGELLEFSFANPPRKRAGPKLSSASGSRSGSISPTSQLHRTRHSDELQHVRGAHHPGHLVTPPPSAECDKSFASTTLSYQKRLPVTPPAGELTPEPSPKFEPSVLHASGESEANPTTRFQRSKSLDVSASLSGEAKLPLRRALSFSTLEAVKPSHETNLPSKIAPPKDEKPPKRKPVRSRRRLSTSEEPSVSDFLSLSDEDVAGDVSAPLARLPLSSYSKPPNCALPPDPPGLVPPPQVSVGTRLLTLSPPLATRPATAAAFEAARIATRYKFDLVYVVNLWPRRACGKVEMTGRLLAAYGLPYLTSPFRIPESVHLKVLRTEGWLEYRCENVTPEEFSRGYSCSFYTGHSLGNHKGAFTRGSRERKGLSPNRGIVFAAYRLPRADGANLQSDEAELASLRRDAEGLVDMLIDIHMTQRQRRPVPLTGRFAPGIGSSPIGHNTILSI